MAAIFTPGLKVSPETVVVKERQLPLEGTVLVEVGQSVKADDIVGRTELPGKIYPINVANQLGVDPSRLADAMVVPSGGRVERGQVVARTPGLFGLFRAEAQAPVAGTIESVSTVTGQVIFQADPIPVEIDAYLPGRVVEIVPGEGCVVQTPAALVQGIFGLGGETRGPIAVAVDRPTHVLAANALHPHYEGQIVIGGSHVTVEAVKRARDLGVKGIVTGGFDYDEIKELLGYEVGVAITGAEELGLTLIVTEGFGEIGMAPATFALLKSKAGRVASLNGATQIRAGVIRPEVVVPLDATAEAERVQPEEPAGIAVGDTVRGIRAPWFGRLGTVKGLPVDPIVLASGSRARVMEVEFADGEIALLPRSNVEVIEA